MKSFRYKIGKLLIVIAIIGGPISIAQGQVKLTPDTLECHIVSFHVGALMAGEGSNSQGLTGGNMGDLYGSPYLDFGLEWSYKTADRWLTSLDADMWFGLTSDNLKLRYERMGSVFTPTGIAMSWGGYSGDVQIYNRGLSVRPGVGYIVPILPKNPNSGLLLKVSGGWLTQKSIFNQEFDKSPVPQLHGDYAKLYDHLRHGIVLTESIGFIYMSNYLTYANFKVTFDISQCWMWSARPYTIDNLMGLNGKDSSRYFDLMYGVKLTWMFPFTGKTSYDYYYY